MRHLLISIGSLLFSLSGFCQLSIGPTGLFLPGGVAFSVDSLVLIPATDLIISNDTLTHNYVPVTGPVPGATSIARVYRWTVPITYSGELGLFYLDTELAGNTEVLLQIAYGEVPPVTTVTSSVFTTTNYVSYPANGITFSRVTATTAGFILPITYTGFSATVKDQLVLLNWRMEEIDGLHGFEVEFSSNVLNWTTAFAVPAPPGKKVFSVQHNDIHFSTRHYRVAMLNINGERTYTRVVTVYNNNAGSGLHIVRNGAVARFTFSGIAPATLQVYGMSGQLLITQAVVQQQCDISGLVPGTYILSYVAGGQKISRKVQF